MLFIVNMILSTELIGKKKKYIFLNYQGQLNGQSQYACRGEGNFDYFVWNMPFEFGFRSLNPSGWPQIVITCVYPDFLGREVIKGYGVVHIPTQPGRYFLSN